MTTITAHPPTPSHPLDRSVLAALGQTPALPSRRDLRGTRRRPSLLAEILAAGQSRPRGRHAAEETGTARGQVDQLQGMLARPGQGMAW
jgi:hypothetical protein